jgi:type II secretory pathway component GspD/PulD (secretin)
MTLPPNRRAFLPACLTLGTLLCALPALADSPAVPAGVVQAKTLPLQNAVPGEILKTLHWDQAANLPAGVTQISAQPATNSLSVVATPAGLAQVRQIIKMMDIAPRQVQIKMALAHVTDADLKASGVVFESAPLPSLLTLPMPDTKYAAGSAVALLLQTVTKRGAVTQAPVITTTNNVAASIAQSTTLPSQAVLSETFAVTPRINSDDSVTLALHLVLLDGTAKREIKTLRTVQNRDTLVLAMLSSDPAKGRGSLLLFATPTIVTTNKGAATLTVK